MCISVTSVALRVAMLVIGVFGSRVPVIILLSFASVTSFMATVVGAITTMRFSCVLLLLVIFIVMFGLFISNFVGFVLLTYVLLIRARVVPIFAVVVASSFVVSFNIKKVAIRINEGAITIKIKTVFIVEASWRVPIFFVIFFTVEWLLIVRFLDKLGVLGRRVLRICLFLS